MPTPLSSASADRIASTSTAFFLDVDGTLLGFESSPEDVVADAALITLLQNLSGVAAGALALVSGRMVSDLDRIVAPLHLPVAGLHGADIRFADGDRAVIDGSVVDPVRRAVHDFVEARPGLLLEDKGATLAIHYRQTPEREDEVRSFLAALRQGHDLAVQEGKLVAELKPAGCNKGHAILALMRSPPFHGRTPLFIGDDRTDEHGFEAVNKEGGMSIKVGSPETATLAKAKLADPAAVRAFLDVICRSAPAK